MGQTCIGGFDLTDHIDTVILRALIDPEDSPELKRAARDILYKTNSEPVGVCHAVIGEAFAGIINDRGPECCQDAAFEFHKYHKRLEKIEIRGIVDPAKVHTLALELHESDAYLEPNDVHILAVALADPDCDTFITRDSRVLTSTEAKRIAQDNGSTIKPTR